MSSEIITPDQLKNQAHDAFKQEDYLEAGRLFKAAADGYQAAGEPLQANEILNNCSVAYLKGGDAKLAYEIVKDTPSVFEKVGDFIRQGKALGNLGAALEGLGRYPEAMQAYQQSSELLKQTGDHEYRAYVLQALSALQLKTGQQVEALATMQTGLAEFQNPTLKQRLLKKFIQIPFGLLNKK